MIMWVSLVTVMTISAGLGFLYKDKVYSVGRKISFISKILFKQLVYTIAENYGLISGDKKIAENLNVAKVSYRNLRGDICIFHIPFMKENVRLMKDKIVLLEKEGRNGSSVYENITQEPGMAYLLSPFELGGRKILIYSCPQGWNYKNFLVDGKPLMEVEKHEKLPLKFNFEKKEEEVLF